MKGAVEELANNRKSFATGALILAIGGLVGKVIGALYRIPLIAIIGKDGIGYYQRVYPIYAALLAISAAGLPTAVSRLVARNTEKGNEAGAKRVFHVALIAFTLLGAVLTFGLLALSLGGVIGNEQLRPGLIAISGSVLFASVISAYRGYFQGHQRMEPTTISQLIEQAIKLIVGLWLASRWYQANIDDPLRAAVYGAAGGIVGVTASEAISLLYLMMQYAFGKAQRGIKPSHDPFKAILKDLLAIAVPISIGAAAMPIVQTIDTVMVTGRLVAIGYDPEVANGLFGILTGMINTLINMPAVITVGLSASLVPAITRALTAGANDEARRSAFSGYKIALLIGMPSAVGLYLLADPIISLLYGNTPNMTQADFALAGQLLRYMAIGVVFLSVVQTSTGILQGYGKPTWPVIVLLLSALPKIALNYVLVAIPSLNIVGATYSTIACYGIAAIADTILMARISGGRIRVGDLFVRPLVSAAGMGAVLYAWIRFVGVDGARMTLLSIVVAIVAYAALIVLTGTLNRDDLAFLPGGGKLARLMERLHVLR